MQTASTGTTEYDPRFNCSNDLETGPVISEKSFGPREEDSEDGTSTDSTSCTSESTPGARSEILDRIHHGKPAVSIAVPAVEGEAAHPLPPKKASRVYRCIRWSVLSVYRRLFTLAFLANIVVLLVLVIMWITGRRALVSGDIVTAVSANIFAAIAIRNEHVVNLLFEISVRSPLRLPLYVRRFLAGVYSYGGLHSGCGVAAVAWYVLFTAVVTRDFLQSNLGKPMIVVTAWMILALFALILIFAHPVLRAALHDYFELTHRFAGWTVVFLFWLQIALTAVAAERSGGGSLGSVLVKTPSFWLLLLVTLCIVYPWTRLRKRAVITERLSSHAARVYFDHGSVETCKTVRLADNPLVETHAFAAIPAPGGQKGFSVVVSNAGDWTKRLIENPRDKLWVKGVPTWGVIMVASMFQPVVVVATGSGIGPCLSLFTGSQPHRYRILWSTRSPKQTYGKGILDDVLEADPNAVIVDTDKHGRPDMVGLTYKLYREIEAEAVVVVSNSRMTKKLVYGMKSRGIPAYGPIWDS